jgi:hypothetical protein
MRLIIIIVVLLAAIAATMLRNEESDGRRDYEDHHVVAVQEGSLAGIIAVPQSGSVCVSTQPVKKYTPSAGVIQTDLFRSAEVTDYTLLALPSTQAFSWKLQGSSDSANFVTLDTQTNVEFNPDIVTAVTYHVVNPGFYKDYRIKFSGQAGSINPNNVFILIQLCTA